jgi:hypothetical protein
VVVRLQVFGYRKAKRSIGETDASQAHVALLQNLPLNYDNTHVGHN